MNKKFHSIGETCKTTGLNHSTIRFWEKTFTTLQPERSSGGHRYFNSEQIQLLLRIKELVYEQGYTLTGAKQRIDEDTFADATDSTTNASAIKKELEEILKLLED